MFELSIHVGATVVAGPVTKVNLAEDSAQLGAEFPADTPVLPIGTEVGVRIHFEGERDPTEVTGHLTLQARQGEVVFCEVSFARATANLIRSHIYERRAPRVRPSTTAPVRANVPGCASISVHDISTGGVGLLISNEAQGRMSRWSLHLSLHLPDEPKPFKFFGEIRLRRLLGSTLLYGIQFDPDRTADFATKQEALHKYVMRRQMEALQERAARRLA